MALNGPGTREWTLVSRAGGFSGVDISATVVLPPFPIPGIGGDDLDGVVFQLGSIQTLSWSVYSQKTPVRALGYKRPLGYARGGRTIAGTMIFNQLHTHPFDDVGMASVLDPTQSGILSYSSGSVRYVRTQTSNNLLTPAGDEEIVYFSPEIQRRHMYDFSWDQRAMGRKLHPADMPPFDIIIVYVNELGNIAKMVLYGVELIHESSVLSIDDIYTEVTYQYVAEDIEYFHAENWDQAKTWRSTVLLRDLDLIGTADVIEANSRILDLVRANEVGGANTVLPDSATDPSVPDLPPAEEASTRRTTDDLRNLGRFTGFSGRHGFGGL